jgi:hypothetical protein
MTESDLLYFKAVSRHLSQATDEILSLDTFTNLSRTVLGMLQPAVQ